MRPRTGGIDTLDTVEEYRRRFDALFARGSGAVLAGSHHRDSPPVDGGRWGMTVVFLPDDVVAGRLEAITSEAMAVAGPGHWPTGNRIAVHFTVRAVEAHRACVPDGDPFAARCAGALDRAAAAEPVRLRLSGLTLTPAGVLVCGYPVGRAAADFAARLSGELGPDGWFEEHYHRDIWYATLVHFAGAIADRRALVRWVDQRRDVAVGEAVFGAAELVRFEHDGRQPVRVRLARAALRGSGARAAHDLGVPPGASARTGRT
jgi:hypothetical protein